MFKQLIQQRLEHYVKRYFKKHPEVKLVVVAGSVGKTSTKRAVGSVLSQRYRIRMHEGNYNAELSAPVAMLGIEMPLNIRDLRQWMAVFRAARVRINEPTDVDVIVQELGTDRIGQLPHFGTYLKPDVAVITGVVAEHMEYFKTLDNVAAEELSAANFSQVALINRDDIDGKYAADIQNPAINTYGMSAAAEYRFEEEDMSLEKGFVGSFISPNAEPVKSEVHVLGESGVKAAVAGAAVGEKLGLTPDEIAKGLAAVRPVSGRMNPLRGVEDSMIIDDTYNSSPSSAAAALTALYSFQAPQKIAVLGNMNELGAMVSEAHTQVGELCDPSQLAWVVTVGDNAKTYLAEAARKRGCQVRSFDNALQAGAFVHQVMESHAIVLFKGSESGVFLEEGIKIVLHETEEENQLVRQSNAWRVRKEKYFASFQ
jgi:UDP-N-acetylmuramoyl-tripeptide--D-alanyl-D-alanine ligase